MIYLYYSIQTLIELDIHGNDIDDEEVLCLIQIFLYNKVQSLFSSRVFWIDSDTIIQTLAKLNLAQNLITAASAAYIAGILLNNKVTEGLTHFYKYSYFSLQTLTTLNLGGNAVGDTGAGFLATALQYNDVKQTSWIFYSHRNDFFQTLKTLHIGRNGIGIEGAHHLANALNQNSVRKQLSYSIGSHPF